MSITSKLSMLGIAGASVLTASLAAAQPTPGSIIPDKDALTFEHVPNRVFVRFIDPAAINSRAAVLADVGGQITSSSKIVPGLHCIETDVSVEQALKTLGPGGVAVAVVGSEHVAAIGRQFGKTDPKKVEQLLAGPPVSDSLIAVALPSVAVGAPLALGDVAIGGARRIVLNLSNPNPVPLEISSMRLWLHGGGRAAVTLLALRDGVGDDAAETRGSASVGASMLEVSEGGDTAAELAAGEARRGGADATSASGNHATAKGSTDGSSSDGPSNQRGGLPPPGAQPGVPAPKKKPKKGGKGDGRAPPA